MDRLLNIITCWRKNSVPSGTRGAWLWRSDFCIYDAKYHLFSLILSVNLVSPGNFYQSLFKMKHPSTSLFAAAAVSLLPLTGADYTDIRTNASEVPLYGLSPPVYPTRKSNSCFTNLHNLILHSNWKWYNFICLGRCLRVCQILSFSDDAGREIQLDSGIYW